MLILSQNFNVSLVIVHENQFLPRSFSMNFEFEYVTTEEKNLRVTLDRLSCFASVLSNTVVISSLSSNYQKLMRFLKPTNRLVVLPTPMTEINLGACLNSKFFAICDENLEIIESRMTNAIDYGLTSQMGYIYTEIDEFESKLADPWWTRNDLSTNDIKGIVVPSWEELGLGYESDPEMVFVQ